ncbi:ribulose-phosphate 3-epimerase [Cellulomonas aerilata]|uniref:Ribulose-phosphate 3-epimerase n=1 Tax=Cellulomonas aerilata TaxID=515326 RepID=A0A512DDJ8_9CELL|nr:ribulose-phosphate 3-epimerase [Cellulomonas aerilata]
MAASLWSVPREQLEPEARRLAAAGLQRWHWDVADGRFAADGGFTPDDVARLTASTGLPGEAHLMVTDPVGVVDGWTDVCSTVVVHAEADRWQEAVERIRTRGRRAAVAVSPGTPVDAVADLDAGVGVLLMSITPGRAGEPFLPATLERLSALRGRPLLGVDGGVTRELAHRCVAHGATWIISGSDLRRSADPTAWIRGVEDGRAEV